MPHDNQLVISTNLGTGVFFTAKKQVVDIKLPAKQSCVVSNSSEDVLRIRQAEDKIEFVALDKVAIWIEFSPDYKLAHVIKMNVWRYYWIVEQVKQLKNPKQQLAQLNHTVNLLKSPFALL